MEKKFKIQKVPLESLLQALASLWKEGAEFVDIDASTNSLRDKIEVSAKDDYYVEFLFFPVSKDEYEELIYLGPDGSKEK